MSNRILDPLDPAGGFTGLLGLGMVGVVAGEMPAGVLGYYDHAAGTIHVDRGMDRRSRHLTVVHERFHKAMKHEPCATPGVRVAREIQVEGMTAKYFIKFHALLDAFMHCSDAQGMAEFLNVDCGLIYARLLHLDPLERLMLDVCAVRCIGIELSTLHPEGALVA